jgi:hypothetical protein
MLISSMSEVEIGLARGEPRPPVTEPLLVFLDTATISSTQRRADAQHSGQSNVMATTTLASATTPGFTQLELRSAYGVNQILLRLDDLI